ncbi:hypothetical protein V7266_01375 [Neobacillus drentensis]|uniref:hypothetical protein n=1 Tax=Neobacillus drentensis TaxID=220684 RepID=UPI002FFD9184
MSKDVAKKLLGKVIQVDRNGPESTIGKLLHVGRDYIAILTDEGVVYYNSHHIKSFTENKGDMEINVEVPEGFEFKVTDDFKGLFESSQYDWIRINRSGPETVEGLLAGLEDDFAVLVNYDEVIRIALFHIKNISYEKAKSINDESNYESFDESYDESSSSSS